MDERAKILEGLEPLFRKAERENLWFFSKYQQLWFSPEELRKEIENGHYIWSVQNWILRDPSARYNKQNMNLFGACYILHQAEKGASFTDEVMTEAKKIVAVAQAEFIALKAQINES